MNEIYKIVLERNRNRQVLNKSDIKRICKGANVLDDALAIRGSLAKTSKDKLEEWI